MYRGKPQLTLSVSVDSLGWEILKNRPFLDELLTTRAPLQTVLGYSCACLPTILTGQMPRDHGHLAFYYYLPESSPFVSLSVLGRLPRAISHRSRVRRLLSRLVAARLGYTGYFQLHNVPFERLRHFDYLEKKDVYESGPCSGTPTIFDHLRANNTPSFVSNWRQPDEINLRALESALDGGDLRFAFLTLSGLASAVHTHGTTSNLVSQKIAWFETQLRRVVALARRHYEVSVMLFSDHGVTDVVEHCDLISRIERIGLTYGTDYVAMYDSTMARFWFLRAPAREAILGALTEEKRGSLLSDRQLAQYGCDFMDRRYGEAFFVLQPGVLLSPSYMGGKPMKAMHGYQPEAPTSHAVFATNLEPPALPRRLDDLYGIMRDDVSLDLTSKIVC